MHLYCRATITIITTGRTWRGQADGQADGQAGLAGPAGLLGLLAWGKGVITMIDPLPPCSWPPWPSPGLLHPAGRGIWGIRGSGHHLSISQISGGIRGSNPLGILRRSWDPGDYCNNTRLQVNSASTLKDLRIPECLT